MKKFTILKTIVIGIVFCLFLVGCDSDAGPKWPSNINNTSWISGSYGFVFSSGNKMTIVNGTGKSVTRTEHTLVSAVNNGKIVVKSDSTGKEQTFCESYSVSGNKITTKGGLAGNGTYNKN